MENLKLESCINEKKAEASLSSHRDVVELTKVKNLSLLIGVLTEKYLAYKGLLIEVLTNYSCNLY